MKRVMYVTLARTDSKPDNRVLRTLDAIKAHGFDILEASCAAGVYRLGYEWRCVAPNQTRYSFPPVISRNRQNAIAALAQVLGQDLQFMEGAEADLMAA